jgi:hypothetical protein
MNGLAISTLLSLSSSDFAREVNISSAQTGTLLIEDSTFKAKLTLSSLQSEHSLVLTGSTFADAVQLGDARLREGVIENSTFASQMGMIAAEVKNGLTVVHSQFTHGIDLSRSHIGASYIWTAIGASVLWVFQRQPQQAQPPTVWSHVRTASDHLFCSFDMLLPIIEFDKRHAEEVLKHPGNGVRYYFYVHQLIGYLLAFFLVAGLAGITK